MIHALYVNANGHVRPRMCTPLGLLGSACLLHEETQPLSPISKLPEPFQNPHEGGPGVDTTSITAMMAGPMAALVPSPNLPGSTEVLPLAKYGTPSCVICLPSGAV